jgi:CRISPR/Cas system-associated endoribonuclease Cas2
MCGYPPYGTQVILNGHEWVERQAQRQQVTVAKSGNCFVEGSDFAQVNRLAARLQRASAIGKLAAVCERWLYSSALCFALTREEQQRSGFQYQYSVFQLELSRNLLFARGSTMDEVYQKLIDRTRQPLELEHLKTIFGFRHRPRQKLKRGRRGPEVAKEVQAHGYDLTVFKVRWGTWPSRSTTRAGGCCGWKWWCITPRNCGAARCCRSCRTCWSG